MGVELSTVRGQHLSSLIAATGYCPRAGVLSFIVPGAIVAALGDPVLSVSHRRKYHG